MEIVDALEHLRAHHRSVLATRRGDSQPQLSPVVHAVGEDHRVLISTREPALKVHNLRRDPHASLCAITDSFFGPWVQVDGTAEIIPLPAAMDLLVATYRHVAGEHPDWDDFRRAMTRDRRVIIAITVERAGPDRSG